MGCTKCSRLIAGLFLSLVASFSSAELILTAPPRQSLDEGRQTFDPVAKFMSEIIGEPVVYRQPHDWADYSAEMRAGKYDIVFDGPHFAAWRIKHLGHTPIAKLPGTLDFLIITRWDDKRINRVRDLASKVVCGLPSPNLATITAISRFSNPVLQPEVYEVKGGFDEVILALKEGKCRAAVTRDNAYKKLADEEKKLFRVIYKSPSYPNQTFTVGERVKPRARERLIAALTEKKPVPAVENIFVQFSKNAKFFVPARSEDYTNLESLLEGVVWGW